VVKEMSHFHYPNTPVRTFYCHDNDVTENWTSIREKIDVTALNRVKRLSLLQLTYSVSNDSSGFEKFHRYKDIIFKVGAFQYFACCLCHGSSTAKDDKVILRYHMNPENKEFPIKWQVGGGNFSNAFKHIYTNHPEFVRIEDLSVVSEFVTNNQKVIPQQTVKQTGIDELIANQNQVNSKIQERVLQAQVQAIAHGQLPINLFSGEVMSTFVKTILNKGTNDIFFGRTKITEALDTFLQSERIQKRTFMNELVRVSPLGKYVAITTDLSTGRNSGKYYVATLHVIDKNLQLIENVICVKDLSLMHSGQNNRAITVKEILYFFGEIEHNDNDFNEDDASEYAKTIYFDKLSAFVHTITADCASNNGTAFDPVPSTER